MLSILILIPLLSFSDIFTSNTCPTRYFNPVMLHEINWLHPIHDRPFCILSSHTPEATFFLFQWHMCENHLFSCAAFHTTSTHCCYNYRMSPHHLIWLFILANLTTCHILYASVSQPPGRGLVPGPGINYTGPWEILLKLITNLNVILYLSTCHTIHIIVLILFMITP